MKILHLISQRPDATGSGIYLQAIVKEAAKCGYGNALIAAANSSSVPNTSTLPVTDASFIFFESADLDFTLPGMSDVMPYPSSRFQDLSLRQISRYESVFLEKVSEKISTFAPDIIHSHHLWLLSSIIKKHFPQIPMVTSSHGTDLRQFRLCPNLREKVLEGCSSIEMIFSLTDAQKLEIMSQYGLPSAKIAVIGAGYNNDVFYRSEKKNPPPIHIAYCGKLSRAKGVPWLLTALAGIGDIDYHFHLIGSGSGAEEASCLELAEKLGDRITIHGAIDQAELATVFHKSHIFVLPSLYEGLPLVIIEALACGCRVITTNLPGCLAINKAVNTDFISLVPLPRLHTIDSPISEDEALFTHNIQKEIRKTCDLFLQQQITMAPTLETKMAQFSWQSVFTRIEEYYHRIL